MPGSVRMVSPDGNAVEVPESEVAYYANNLDYTIQGNQQRVDANVEAGREAYFNSPAERVKAAEAAFARGVTGGLSDAAIVGLSGEDARRELEGLKEYNSKTSTGFEIAGALTPVGAGGAAVRAGKAAAGIVKGTGVASRIARTGISGVVEGGIQGIGSGVSELALSEEPLSIERAASVIGSNVLYGGAAGGALNVAGAGLGAGLRAARGKLDDIASHATATGDDIAKLDRKGLRLAEKKELEIVEAARVPERAKVADEIAAFRKELKDQKVWLATKGVDDAALKAAGIGKRTLDADRALDKLLRDPKALAETPQAALKQLRIQEAALDELVNKHGTRLKQTVFAADTTGTRAAALDNAALALEKNRAIQAKLADLAAPPATPKLQAIADAKAALDAPKAGQTAGSMATDMAMGYAVGELTGIPGVGAVIAAGRVAMPLLKKLGANSAKAAERGSQAITTFLNTSSRVAPYAPVLASKVLNSVRYSDKKERAPGPKSNRKPATLADSFKAREREIREQIEPGPAGEPLMRPAARARVAARLAPIAAAQPTLADKLESMAARRIEFLASKLPKRPDIAGVPAGPDNWRPSDMEMRAFARYVAAVEDPHAVIERLASGQITPEDVEAVKTVYPELHADVTQQVIRELPTLRQKLPYQRRLALSMFTGVAVDPAMSPEILAVLQGSFTDEPGTEEGTQAPRAQPAFGSVSKEVATPAQSRGAP
jgi:hypothetical protein